jgi:hypothetical protein
MSDEHSAREKYIKIFLAVFSTTSAAASPGNLDPLCRSIPAVIAIALPMVNYSGLAEKTVDQKGNGPGS